MFNIFSWLGILELSVILFGFFCFYSIGLVRGYSHCVNDFLDSGKITEDDVDNMLDDLNKKDDNKGD